MSCLYNFHTQICCRHTAKSGSSVRKRETPQKTVCLSGFLCWLMNHRDTEELRILLQQFVEVCPSNLSPEVSGSKTCLPGVLAIFLKPRSLSLGAEGVHFKTRGYGWQNQGGWTPQWNSAWWKPESSTAQSKAHESMTHVSPMGYPVIPEHQMLLDGLVWSDSPFFISALGFKKNQKKQMNKKPSSLPK